MSQQFKEVRNLEAISQTENNDSVEKQIEDDAETMAVANNQKFLAILKRSRQRQKTEGGISIEEMRQRLGLDD
ncbi:MAG: hypothetical protein DSM107014_16690 [Gomphosphaeria aponina SAG 52.96 = DSM 107014]|uniref:Uncharacterized protein n=1 Tax=Gomphosphaeria aponina SAG 52.96 = DSM 107014 TaxID=1521640 RepID=A0A941GY08_9CHRO|nr:hypothetical protein [Gomphosphaeria aponina SAG 52.96 = DSM 107014]